MTAALLVIGSLAAGAQSDAPATPEPTAPALAGDVATWVTGLARWDDTVTFDSEVFLEDGTRSSRGAVYRLTLVTGDPRLDGTMTDTAHFDEFGRPPDHDPLAVLWGTKRIENADGSWEGPATGATGSDGCWTETVWLTGDGAYAGLSAYLHIRNCDEDPAGTVEGMIFPGEVPPRE